MTDKTDKPEGRVIAGGDDPHDLFSKMSGGRSDYGGLILSALTGKTQEELLNDVVGMDGIPQEAKDALRKEIARGGDVSATLLDAEDQFFLEYARIGALGGPSLLNPSIAPERLERLVAENNSLEPCIQAMVTNVAGTGYQLLPREGTETDLTEDDKQYRDGIQDFLNECSPRKSFLRVRKELKRDLYTTGNSYAVVERTATGEIAFIKRAPAKSMRLLKLDDPTPVKVRVVRFGQEVELTTMRAERRFVQKIGAKLVYYKEYGSERDLDRHTGAWADAGSLPAEKRAHEIIHEKDIEDVRSPYGVPRWITQLPSVLGSRMAEEHNLAFFHSGGVPPVIVFVSGGLVSDKVSQTLNTYLTGGAKNKRRGIAVEVPSSGQLENERAASVSVERFGGQDADSTFENYDEKNEKRIRKAFRLPGIFFGMADSYNFASAHASYVVAEAQVFAPERAEEDEVWNMTLMRELDDQMRFKFKSNSLTVKDVTLQLQALTLLGNAKGVSLSDWVDTISDIASLDLGVSEEYEDAVIGEGVSPTGDGPDQTGAGAEGVPQGDGAQPPANSPNQPQQPAPGVSAQKRKALVIAASIGRAIRDFEDDNTDIDCLSKLVDLEKLYDALDDDDRATVDQHLAPVIYTSAYLTDIAMNDLSRSYAKSAFADARNRLTAKAH
jgi:capsid portal protein